MFTLKDIKLLEQPYFHVIRCTEEFYEIQSCNTNHCWIIQKIYSQDRRPVQIYHKHTIKTAYYHNHAFAINVEHAVKLIKDHDDYVLHPEKYITVDNAQLAQ